MAHYSKDHKLVDRSTARSSINSYSLVKPQMRNSFEKVLRKKSSVNFSILRGLMNQTPSNAKSLESAKQPEGLRRSRSICCFKSFAHYKKIAYVILQQPGSSLLAKIIHTIIILAILASVFEGIFLVPKDIRNYPTPLIFVDSVIALIFALELIARVLSITAFEGKSKKDLIRPILLIDIIGLIPIFAEIPIDEDGPLSAIVNKKILNTLKTLLILKLLRYMKGAYIFANGVRKSLSSFVFLVLVIIIANFTFATMIYFAERTNPYSNFNEGIPMALWYTIVTMTTVGYGDVVPTTAAAKVITSGVAVFGMLVIALPVVILGYHFQEAFNEREEEIHIKKMKDYHLTLLQNLDKRKKETYFLQKRIENIEDFNKKVKEELEKSGTIYKRVSKDLRTLYRSIYASDNDKDLDDIDSSMKRKVLLMEKLARTRRKIKLVTIFNRLNNGSRELTSPDYIKSPTRSPKKGLQLQSRIFDEIQGADEVDLHNVHGELSPPSLGSKLTSLTEYMLQNKIDSSAARVSNFNPNTSVMLQEKLEKEYKTDPRRPRLKIKPPQIIVECDLSEDECSRIDSVGINKVKSANSKSSMMELRTPSPSLMSRSPGNQTFHQSFDESSIRLKAVRPSVAVTTHWPSCAETTAAASTFKLNSSLQSVDKQSSSPFVLVHSPKRSSLSPLYGSNTKKFIRFPVNEDLG